MAKVQNTGSDDVAATIAFLEAQIAELQRQAAPPDEGNHRRRDRLTARFCATVKKPGFYADGGNLFLRGRGRNKSWVFRWKSNGRTHDFGLGRYPDVSLAEARELAEDCRRKIRSGIDPIEERKAAKLSKRLDHAKAITFEAAATQYMDAHRSEWGSAKHAAQWPSSLKQHVYPVIGKLPVAAIDTGLVMKVLSPIWLERTVTAERVRGRIEKILGASTTAGHRTGDNPARWSGHLENLLAKKSRAVKHLAALAIDELPAFFATLTELTSLPSLALQFAILTAARSGEATGATWEEIDIAARMWTIPGERMKSGREHRVPLSDPALAILATCQVLPTSRYVFAAGPKRSIGGGAMLKTLKTLNPALTVHGFRSVFSDWTAERTGASADTREASLAHAIADKVDASYRRGDQFRKRQQLMATWAKFVTSAKPEGNVVPLARTTRPA